MIFDLVVRTLKNKHIEAVDSTNPNQCFDLGVTWLDVLEVERSFNHLHAYEIFLSPTPLTKKNFEIIPNSADTFPIEGDIVVWSKAYGPSGHVAIAASGATTKAFKAFSQNDPTGSPCILKDYKYTGVLGWLRPKKFVDPYLVLQEEKEKYKNEAQSLRNVVDAQKEKIDELEKQATQKISVKGSLASLISALKEGRWE